MSTLKSTAWETDPTHRKVLKAGDVARRVCCDEHFWQPANTACWCGDVHELGTEHPREVTR